MIYNISNRYLSVSINSLGAELYSILSSDGTEYIWQRDSRYWGSSSPTLFPYIARLYDNSYTYYGKRYSMGIHGFAAKNEFTAEKITDDSVTMVLCENDATLMQYPFSFKLSITYTLSASTLRISYTVKNNDSKLMPFALGAHPGINVPLSAEANFEDYFLSFDEACAPNRIGFTDEVFLSGEKTPYALENGRTIRLNHGLFDDDAIILSDTAKRVTLGCSKSKKSLSIYFPGFDYFGIWHRPHTDAPYVCLEPWTSLPSRQGIIEELTEKADLIMLQPGQEYENELFITISEE